MYLVRDVSEFVFGELSGIGGRHFRVAPGFEIDGLYPDKSFAGFPWPVFPPVQTQTLPRCRVLGDLHPTFRV